MKDSRATFTGPQTYGKDSGLPSAFANRLDELERRCERREKRKKRKYANKST